MFVFFCQWQSNQEVSVTVILWSENETTRLDELTHPTSTLICIYNYLLFFINSEVC